jgi:hypothetical protein
MYVRRKAVIFSEVTDVGSRSVFDYLPTNGRLIRNDRGVVVGKYGCEDRGIYYMCDCRGRSYFGNILDTVLVARIQEYFDHYFHTRKTNCASMAQYLTTGEFTEPGNAAAMLVLNQGMRPYDSASRVQIGDMVCILYAQHFLKSRKLPNVRQLMRRAKKVWHQRQTFVANTTLSHSSYTPTQIRSMYASGAFADFHFMVCVDRLQGQPVWLSQLGYREIDEEQVSVVLTVGEHNPYPDCVPMYTLIKKRRGK